MEWQSILKTAQLDRGNTYSWNPYLHAGSTTWFLRCFLSPNQAWIRWATTLATFWDVAIFTPIFRHPFRCSIFSWQNPPKPSNFTAFHPKPWFFGPGLIWCPRRFWCLDTLSSGWTGDPVSSIIVLCTSAGPGWDTWIRICDDICI